MESEEVKLPRLGKRYTWPISVAGLRPTSSIQGNPK
jgi:hypothetical protein